MMARCALPHGGPGTLLSLPNCSTQPPCWRVSRTAAVASGAAPPAWRHGHVLSDGAVCSPPARRCSCGSARRPAGVTCGTSSNTWATGSVAVAATAVAPACPHNSRGSAARHGVVCATAAAAVAGAATADAGAVATAPTLASTAPQQQQEGQGPPSQPCDALIVGAGPAGLAMALMLARRPGWDRIVVLEQRPDLEMEDPDRSYVYMIDGRGKVVTDEAGVTDAVCAAGVSMDKVQLRRVLPDGTTTTTVLNFFKEGEQRFNMWLPRRMFLRALRSGLPPLGRSDEGSSAKQQVQLLQSTAVTSIQISSSSSSSGSSGSSGSGGKTGGAGAGGPAEQHPVVVRARNTATGEDVAFAPRLLLGCDGMHSTVRAALEEWAPAAGGVLSREAFTPVVLDTPAAGLRFKVIQLPPNAPFRPASSGAGTAATASGGSGTGGSGAAGGEQQQQQEHRLENSKFGKVEGVKAPPMRTMALGLLPLKDPSSPRLANVIQPPEHHFWSLTTGPQLHAFLQESFPQLDIASLMTTEQLEATAAARGGVFPKVHYLRHFTAVLAPPAAGHGTEAAGAAAPAAAAAAPAADAAARPAATAGVVLLGDALHCFPPDLGQGVNSALQDITVLCRSLDDCGGDLAAALPLFESRRAPDVQALAELMTFSWPYQYGQDPSKRVLWGLNVMARMVLSKFLGWAGFHPHSLMLLQDVSLPYSEVLARAHATTAKLWALGAVVLAAAAFLAAKVVLKF